METLNKRARRIARKTEATKPGTLGNDASGNPIPVPGANAVPAPNEVRGIPSVEDAAQTARVASVAAAILAVLEQDAALEVDLASRKAAGAESAWSGVMGQVASVATDATLGTLKHRGALVADVIDRVKAAGLTAGPGPLKARTSQYGADLSKVARALKADKDIPADLWKASRTKFNEATFWSDAGAKSTRGRKPAGKVNQTGGKPDAGKASSAESIGAAAVSSFKVKEADALSEVLKLVDGLRGPFRKEWLDGAKELALAIAARQAQAGTGTK